MYIYIVIIVIIMVRMFSDIPLDSRHYSKHRMENLSLPPNPPVLTREATLGRNVCPECGGSNLSRAHGCCTICGHGMVLPITTCARCTHLTDARWVRCVHCGARRTRSVPGKTYMHIVFFCLSLVTSLVYLTTGHTA